VSDYPAPPGYESFLAGRAHVVAQQAASVAIRSAMTGVSLHEWASRQPGAQPMQGRATAWATALPTGDEIVVRHSRHGGLLARITGDLFFAPTRAPHELAAALRLAAVGVMTPEVIAYVVYPAFGPLVRADVATRLLRGAPLPEAWRAAATEDARWVLVEAIARLLESLHRAGAAHPDLNVRNVLVTDGGVAAVLDVDRVTFGSGAAGANVQRLLRSMRKQRAAYGIDLTSSQVQRMRVADGAAS
jgi:hypothetical protein